MDVLIVAIKSMEAIMKSTFDNDLHYFIPLTLLHKRFVDVTCPIIHYMGAVTVI